MTLADRAAAYAAAFPQFPASHLHVAEEQGQPVLYGIWQLGNDYRNRAGYYGEYPPGYLDRVLALFPEAAAPDRRDPQATPVLHLFAGTVPRHPGWLRVDLNPMLEPDIACDVYDLPRRLRFPYSIVLADPPYSDDDAARYNVAPLDRGRALAAIADVTLPGGHLVWLDTCWPMHRKTDWRTAGRIWLIRSTNHRFRGITIFERQAAQ